MIRLIDVSIYEVYFVNKQFSAPFVIAISIAIDRRWNANLYMGIRDQGIVII